MTDFSKIYSAVYSGVPVFEMVVNDVAVMRRRTDSYMNATQILKVANVEKGKRTKILEKEVLSGEHEKVQGGYGKYQGTWIPFEKSRELAERYGVLSELSPLFNFQLDSLGAEDGEDSSLLTKEQAIAARKRLNPETLPKPAKQKPQQKIQALSPTEEQPRKKAKVATVEESSEGSSANEERDRSILMSIFLSDAPEQIPDLLKTTQEKSSFNIDMVIDEQGHTALHWAIALARSKIAEQLVARGANIACTSYAGETPLMRGVMVTNSYDVDTFPKSFDLLRESVSIVDNKKRSVLHHVALTAGIQGRMNAAIYYMKIILENLLEGDEKLKSIINAQDSLGDTALNIAARLECQPLVDLLIEAGAIKSAENNNGLQANDYSDKDVVMEDTAGPPRVFANSSLYSKRPYAPSQRGKEIIATVQKIVDALDDEYGGQLTIKEQELQKVQEDLNKVNNELEATRKGLEERQAQSQRLSEAQQKAKNIENALRTGWTQLEEIMGKSGKRMPDPNYTDSCDENEDLDALFDVPDLKIPENATEEEKKKMLEEHVKSIQAKVKAYTTNDVELKKEIKELEDQFIEKEMQCKRLIAACCNLPIDKIDDLVEPLTLAIESDPPDLDLARVIGFMDKIRRQGAFAEPPSSPAPVSVATPPIASQTLVGSTASDEVANSESPRTTFLKTKEESIKLSENHTTDMPVVDKTSIEDINQSTSHSQDIISYPSDKKDVSIPKAESVEHEQDVEMVKP